MANGKRRAKIRVHDFELTLTRIGTSQTKLVYGLIANKKLKYKYGRSNIAYIGTTRRGLKRIAESVAQRADRILSNHGVTKLTANFVSARGRKGAQVWRKLERAMIITFREKYGEIPRYNTHGKGWQWSDERKYFNRDSILRLFE